jgi:type IV pilus assembly protein PilM
LKPQRKGKSALGLDLGHHRIKAIELDGTPSGWKVLRAASIPTPADAVKEGVIIDVPAVTAAIKQLLKEGKFSQSKALIAAAGGSVFVRSVPFPKMNEATLRKTIRFEASRYVPGSVEESYIDFSIVDQKGEQMNVLVVAAPRDIVATRIAAVEAAGLEVEAVDVEAFAMYRALLETTDQALTHPSTAIVDIGAASTSVSVVHESSFSMNRSIPYGGNTLTEALKNYFKLSSQDAEEGKAQLNLAELIDADGPRENPPLRVIQPHLDDLVREVRRSLNYFQSQSGDGQNGRKVEAIIVSGGGAKLEGTDVYLAHKLGLPVSRLGLYDHPAVLSNESGDEKGLDYVVAGGLAMRSGLKAA